MSTDKVVFEIEELMLTGFYTTHPSHWLNENNWVLNSKEYNFVFTVLPSGLTSAPDILMKIGRVRVKRWRAMDAFYVIYDRAAVLESSRL